MVKVQLGKSGKFFNIKDSCTHPTHYIIRSGAYEYVICKSCGKNIGELQQPKVDEVQGKGKKGS